MIKTSLFADQEREAKRNKPGNALKVMEQHVDFIALAGAFDEAAPRPSGERGGRSPFPTALIVRVPLIQQLFNLSDEQMEFQLLDRLSFRRFVGLRSSSQMHVFAGLAEMGGKGLRAIGLACATLQLNRKVAVYNLRCLVYLKEAKVEAF